MIFWKQSHVAAITVCIAVAQRIVSKPTRHRFTTPFYLSTTAADLELRLGEFQRYFNVHRTHVGLGGLTPEPRTSVDSGAIRTDILLSFAKTASAVYLRDNRAQALMRGLDVVGPR